MDEMQLVENDLRRYAEPIGGSGLSRRKMEAALLCGYTDMKIGDIAAKVGCSYGLIRKWRTEEPFRKVMLDSFQKIADRIHCH